MKLHNARYILPNLVTLSSVFAGFYAMIITARATTAQELIGAIYLLGLSMFLDGCDGRVARATKSESEFGVQLDSLADAIAFGVAPAFLVYRWGLDGLGLPGLIIAFAFAAGGILRLARFNVLAAKGGGASDHFVGLPIPLAAGALLSVILTHLSLSGQAHAQAPWSISLLVLGLSALMVSNVRYRTFKKLRMTRAIGASLLALLALVILLSVRYNPGLPFAGLFSAYILVGLTESLITLGRRRHAALPNTHANDADEADEADDADQAEEAQDIRQ